MSEASTDVLSGKAVLRSIDLLLQDRRVLSLRTR